MPRGSSLSPESSSHPGLVGLPETLIVVGVRRAASSLDPISNVLTDSYSSVQQAGISVTDDALRKRLSGRDPCGISSNRYGEPT